MEIDFRRKVGTLILTLLFVFSATFAFGQIVTGSVSGVVEDQQHAMVGGAKITASQDGTSYQRSTTTNDNGLYSMTGLPVGTYTVTIEAAKFSKLKISNVAVTVAHDTSLGVRTMTIGTTEVVNVEGTAPLVESTTTQISASFENKKVADLPIGSGYDMLALFVPGIAPAGDNGFSNNNGADVSSNGQRGRSNNFQIDGQSNNDNSVAGPSIFMGNQDVIGEFQVITNYSAEFGRNMGSVINYITKGGTNSFHGTAFFYHSTNWGESHTNFENNPFVGGDPNAEYPKFIDNRWGLTFGGPIKKDKAWFFFSYMGEHVRTAGGPSTSATLTPTPAGLTTLTAAYPGNNFVNALNTIGPYAVPAGNPQISPIGTATDCTDVGGTFVPAGGTCIINVTDGVTATDVEFGRVTRALPSLFNDREITGRVDLQLTSKDRLTARYIIQDFITTNATGRGAAGAVVDVPGRTQQIALDWTRSFTSRMVNSFRFNYSRAGFGFEGGTFPDCTQTNVLSCPTGLSMNDGIFLTFGMQNNLPQGRLINNSQWQDNASWVHGRHTIKFGGEYTRQRSPNGFLPNILGTFTYTGGQLGTGYAFDDGLANLPAQLSLTDGQLAFEFKEQDVAFYAQDEWRVKDNLTLIFGVRYEFYQQAINHLAEHSLARQTGPDPLWNTNLPLDVTTVHHIPNDTNNWAPNVGFAWTPKIWKGLFGENKTVIRGGFRVTYDPSYYNIFLNTRTAAPNVNAGFMLGSSLVGGACTDPCLPGTPTGAGVQAAHLPDIPHGTIADFSDPSCTTVQLAVNPGCKSVTLVTDDFRNPYSSQWNIGVQRQVNNKMAFEVRYVGNHTVGNFQTINANPNLRNLILQHFDGTAGCNDGLGGLTALCQNVIPAGVTPCAVATEPGFNNAAGGGRPDCAYRNLRLRANSAWSIYHGLQTRFDISNWHGLTANFGYTWSHTIDNVSEIFSTAGGGTTAASSQNPFEFNRTERADSGLDYRHIATLALIYDLPWYKNQQGVVGHVLGGWQFNITHRYTSGQAYSPQGFNLTTDAACQSSWDGTFIGFSSCRPFLSNPNAPIASQGICTDAAALDCALRDFNGARDPITGAFLDPIAFSDVRYIRNNNAAAHFFGTPYGNAPRNSERGETINNTNFSVFKTTRITERFKLRFETHVWNVLNRRFQGVPDPFFDFGAGDFGTTNFNDSGGFSTNATQSGIGRRRFNFGLKLIF